MGAVVGLLSWRIAANTFAVASLMCRSAGALAAEVLQRPSRIGIVTIRDDKFRAVLAVFPDKIGNVQGSRRPFTLRQADAGGGARYRIAVLRLTEPGQGEAQDAARDLIEDLAPRLVLVVGMDRARLAVEFEAIGSDPAGDRGLRWRESPQRGVGPTR